MPNRNTHAAHDGAHTEPRSESYCYQYPRPAVTVDIVLFAFLQDDLKVLLIERSAGPYTGMWALPGGYVEIDEDIEPAARRELAEETGLRARYMEQLGAFGAPDRDPRTRVITVAYLAIPGATELAEQHMQAADDAADARWWALDELPDLAFDHAQIVDSALQQLRIKMERTTVAFLLLPREFTLSALQRVYESVLDETLDKRNFRRKFLDLDILEESGNLSTGDHRPARLFRRKPNADDVSLARRRFP